jgi:hypothetical protein
MPPTQVAIRPPDLAKSHSSSRLTWSASSRVGATIRASGSRDGASRPSAMSCSAMARPKATVLPEPVWAETRRSRP